jgi:cytochrome c biogenesis protein CcdA
MRDHVGIFFSTVFLLIGAVIVYDGVASSDAGQSARVLAGAAILALGITTMRLVLKNWWKERQLYRESRAASRENEN